MAVGGFLFELFFSKSKCGYAGSRPSIHASIRSLTPTYINLGSLDMDSAFILDLDTSTGLVIVDLMVVVMWIGQIIKGRVMVFYFLDSRLRKSG
jgi:hypothetical protein